MISLEPAEEGDLRELADLASSIWHEYFPCILTEGQIDYMVDRFQSYHAMREQTDRKGYRYCFIVSDGVRIGYTALVPEGDALFISKLYLRKEYRGKGLGSEALKLIFEVCQQEGFASAYLTVNRGNAVAIKAYERNGFTTIRSQVTDIGSGYVMDDYVMEKRFRFLN